MSLRSIVKELRDGIGSISRRSRSKSHIAPEQTGLPPESVEQSPWADLPPELLSDIIRRVEESETSWPARAVVVFCASVCRSWREVTKEIVKTPEQCGRLTFPISLKQSGPREFPIQCYIKRDLATSTYLLYYGLVPSENESDKLLLAAKKVRRATCTDFIISLVSNNFSRSSSTYVGKLRSNFLGTKFTIYDSQPPSNAPAQVKTRSSRRFHSKQVFPKLPACNYNIGTVSYELNVLRTRGPRRMQCTMDSIPVSSILESGTSTSVLSPPANESNSLKVNKGDEQCSSAVIGETSPVTSGLVDALVLKNKSPRWHEQLQCWCLNFKGRVTVASVKNFQLVADIDPAHNMPADEQEKVILQFGKIGKDIFTMDYRYPLSAFQAFAISLSSFDTKPACE